MATKRSRPIYFGSKTFRPNIAECIDQRADCVLVTPEKNQCVASTVQPGPPPGVARADAIVLSEPIEGLFRLAEIQSRQADLLVGPRLARIFRDDRFGRDNAVVESPLRPPQRGVRLQGHEVTRVDRKHAIEQPLRPAQPVVSARFVVPVEEFENERRGDASQTIDAGRLDLERLLEQTTSLYHRCR